MNQQPSDLLRLAHDHVKGLPKGVMGLANLSQQQTNAAIDDALQAIILSAAAAEAATNIELTVPATCIQPFPYRRFFAEIAQQACRASIREKISLLLRNRPDFNLSKADKEKIKYLFDCRNRIIHSTPIYKEYPTSERDLVGLSAEQIAAKGPISSVFEVSVRSTSIFSEARVCFDAAQLLIDRLSSSRTVGTKGSNKRLEATPNKLREL